MWRERFESEQKEGRRRPEGEAWEQPPQQRSAAQRSTAQRPRHTPWLEKLGSPTDAVRFFLSALRPGGFGGAAQTPHSPSASLHQSLWPTTPASSAQVVCGTPSAADQGKAQGRPSTVRTGAPFTPSLGRSSAVAASAEGRLPLLPPPPEWPPPWLLAEMEARRGARSRRRRGARMARGQERKECERLCVGWVREGGGVREGLGLRPGTHLGESVRYPIERGGDLGAWRRARAAQRMCA